MPTTKSNTRKSTKRTTKSPARRTAKRTVKARSNNTRATSPFASAFNSAIKRGTPCTVAVNNVAQRTKNTPKQVFESLFKAGHVNRQKFNGQWVYWASQQPKVNKTNAKQAQIDCWQQFVDWCFANGFCTPQQMSNPSSQSEFMSFCRTFWNRQFNGASSSSKKVARKSSSKSTSAKAKKSSSSAKSKKRSTTAKAKKRSTSVKSKKRTAPKAKRSTTTRAKKSATKSRNSKPRTTVRRKTTSRSNQPASFKFPTATRRIRKAA